MDLLFEQVEPLFKKYVNVPHVEFEFRIGKKNGAFFDTNVGKDTFDKIYTALEQYPSWENVLKTNQTVYYSGIKRYEYNEDTLESKSIIKTTLSKIDSIMEQFPYDVRFSIAEEKPISSIEDNEMESSKTKKRTSFIRKNLSIDLTVVEGEPEDMDDEEDVSYQVELEIINPNKVKNKTELYNLIYKIHSILKPL